MTRTCVIAVGALLLSAAGCDSLPGKPTEAERYVHPNRVLDFESLYALSCSGCHGADGRLGPARALHDPIYLALVPAAVLHQTIGAGIDGTPMPAFAHSKGGTLTDAQVEVLVEGLKQQWGGSTSVELPPYAAESAGDPTRGHQAFRLFCGECHGPEGRGTDKGGSVVDSAFLGLVSDQGLRTSVIVGRGDLDKPDWRGYVPGRTMTNREITDVVAWLVAQRPEFPGQPYPEQHRGGR